MKYKMFLQVLHIAHKLCVVAQIFSGLWQHNRNSRERAGPREDSLQKQSPENGGGQLGQSCLGIFKNISDRRLVDQIKDL